MVWQNFTCLHFQRLFFVDETLHVDYKKIKKRIFIFFGKYQIYFISYAENIKTVH